MMISSRRFSSSKIGSAIANASAYTGLNWLSSENFARSESRLPPLIIAFAFGLSMDYEVFLLARIVELRERGATNDEAVTLGLQRAVQLEGRGRRHAEIVRECTDGRQTIARSDLSQIEARSKLGGEPADGVSVRAGRCGNNVWHRRWPFCGVRHGGVTFGNLSSQTVCFTKIDLSMSISEM